MTDKDKALMLLFKVKKEVGVNQSITAEKKRKIMQDLQNAIKIIEGLEVKL